MPLWLTVAIGLTGSIVGAVVARALFEDNGYVVSFGSLFVVSGKRHGEHIDLGEEGVEVRPTLGAYSRNYLQYVWTMTSGVTVAAYCLWAFEMAPKSESVPLYELSIVPFVTFILRYAMLLEQGHGGTPEDVVLGDRTLLALAAVWAAVFGAGVYVY